MTAPVLTLFHRFWAKADRSGGPEACWPWTGALNRYGYGHFNLGHGYGVVRANRLAMVLGFPGVAEPRDLAAGDLACHTCDSKPCVNPSHLVPGSHSRNLRDQYDRFRRPRKPLAIERARLQKSFNILMDPRRNADCEGASDHDATRSITY